MKLITLLLLFAGVLLLTIAPSQAGGWRGIVPLHSTRADVERMLGKPNFKYDLYDFADERVSIMYSTDPCTEGLQGSYNVPRDTVISIHVIPQNELKFSDIQVNLSKYKKIKDTPQRDHAAYQSEEEGITYIVYEGKEQKDGIVQRILYGPVAKDVNLRCPDATLQIANPDCSRTKRANNNLPLGDPCPTIEINRLSGDSCRSQRHSFSATLAGVDPRFKPTYKWSISAGRITNGQGTYSIEVDASNVSGKTLIVTLEAGGVIPEGCEKDKSYTIECPKN